MREPEVVAPSCHSSVPAEGGKPSTESSGKVCCEGQFRTAVNPPAHDHRSSGDYVESTGVSTNCAQQRDDLIFADLQNVLVPIQPLRVSALLRLFPVQLAGQESLLSLGVGDTLSLFGS